MDNLQSRPSGHPGAHVVEDPAAATLARFRRSGYPFLRQIRCDFSEGVLRLWGTVPTFYLKQLAQELASHTPGVEQVRNNVFVTSWHDRGDATAAG